MYLQNVLHLDFTSTYSGDLVAGMPHGKGMESYHQVVRQNNEFFILKEYISPYNWYL